ncbi:MAG: hypothetical protein RB146_06645 [Armatimonadota bacterium]|nr:hypothetical protein [Armatimonadota bacterium]
MIWRLHRWVWKLQGPLSVGMAPAGALNRCRLYVPARAVWGACTTELAQSRPADFIEAGKKLLERARFSYLFPAEWDGRSWSAWLPRFREGHGLTWAREDDRDGQQPVADRDFRFHLLEARPGTAIDPESDSAADGSLRETECITRRWRRGRGEVALVGYVFTKNDIDLGSVDSLFLGGDTRYGLGAIKREGFDPTGSFFGAQISLEDEDPSVETNRVLGHATTDASMLGALEHVAGWDRSRAGLRSIRAKPLWVPGTATPDNAPRRWWIGDDGIWRDHRRGGERE